MHLCTDRHCEKRLHLDHHSLYEILQILSLTMFEQTPINQLLTTTLHKFRSEFRASTARSPLKKRWDTTEIRLINSPKNVLYCVRFHHERIAKEPVQEASVRRDQTNQP